MENSNLIFQVEHIFRCIDDKKPSFEVNMWISEGELYRCIPSATMDVITGGHAFEWEDMDGNPIIPNASIGCEHILLERFVPVAQIPLN
jgi:hypothetical protein|tara:strand:- start:228 stop:494 length:267 start_codon:yes stop_codon:yes gene_type:complete